MPVRVRPQADQAPSLSRYGLSRSPGAALVKGLLNAGVTRGPVLLLDRPTQEGTGPPAGARSLGVLETAASGAGPDLAEYRVDVLYRGSIARDRPRDGGDGDDRTSRSRGHVGVDVLAARCIADIDIERASVQPAGRRRRPAHSHGTAGCRSRNHRRAGGDVADK